MGKGGGDWSRFANLINEDSDADGGGDSERCHIDLDDRIFLADRTGAGAECFRWRTGGDGGWRLCGRESIPDETDLLAGWID